MMTHRKPPVPSVEFLELRQLMRYGLASLEGTAATVLSPQERAVHANAIANHQTPGVRNLTSGSPGTRSVATHDGQTASGPHATTSSKSYDPELGIHYHRVRYNDPATGRSTRSATSRLDPHPVNLQALNALSAPSAINPATASVSSVASAILECVTSIDIKLTGKGDLGTDYIYTPKNPATNGFDLAITQPFTATITYTDKISSTLQNDTYPTLVWNETCNKPYLTGMKANVAYNVAVDTSTYSKSFFNAWTTRPHTVEIHTVTLNDIPGYHTTTDVNEVDDGVFPGRYTNTIEIIANNPAGCPMPQDKKTVQIDFTLDANNEFVPPTKAPVVS